MAKRFTDTEKWQKQWFRHLTPPQKLFWQFMCDTCTPAGIWTVDMELASSAIGSKVRPEEIRKAMAKQIRVVDGGRRWFLTDFIEFQYKCTIAELNPSNKAHLAVIREVKKWGIESDLSVSSISPLEAPTQAPSEGLPSPTGVGVGVGVGVGQREEDEKKLFGDDVRLTDDEYQKLLTRLRRESRVKEAIDILDAYLGLSEKNKKRYTSHYKAILSWVIGELEEREQKRGKNGSATHAQSSAPVVCERCHKPGHKSYDCPEIKPADPEKVASLLHGMRESLNSLPVLKDGNEQFRCQFCHGIHAPTFTCEAKARLLNKAHAG
jgi:hypothetical protein